MDLSDLRGPAQFNVEGEANVVGTAWEAWVEEFESFADAKGVFQGEGTSAPVIKSRTQRKALMLYCGGPRIREIFKNLNEALATKIAVDDYAGTVELLNKHFIVKPNITFQRHRFRKLVQQSTETIAQYVARLRKASVGCNFTDVNDMIKDQVITCCMSDKLRRKCLEKGDDLDLAELLKLAASHEAIEQQFSEMKLEKAVKPSFSQEFDEPSSSNGSINRLGASGKPRNQQDARFGVSNSSSGSNSDSSLTRKGNCFRCGRQGCWSSDVNCPARKAICRGCSKKGHWQGQCRSSASATSQGKNVQQVEVGAVDESSNVFTCSKKKGSRADKMVIQVGGVGLEVLIDSGAECNVISLDTWKDLVARGVKASSRKSDVKLFPYASSEPLDVHSSFDALVIAGKRQVNAEFVVINDKAQPSLLGLETASAVGVLKIGLDVNNVSALSYEEMLKPYDELFSGLGKMKGLEVKIAVDDSIPPVAQRYSRIPFGLRAKVEEKLKELVDLDIIELVTEPTPWVSPLVVVPKPSGDIRLCVDMRRANEAIIRERFPIPTIEELLQDMCQSRVFSKIDFNLGYHQLCLHPESRNITTFTTHIGNFRYKRMNFGICSAPEKYQAEIQRLLDGIPGVALNRVHSAGLTLNRGKCLFGVNELEFVGHKLSAKGVHPAVSKVEAVVGAKEPQNASEVRGFLGLVNYCSKFIPDYSTKTEPLRRLTRQNVPFVFGDEQKRAFQELKQCLANSETLGYFDLKYPTKVIADASPVGLGAVLVQIQEDGPRIICYASRSLTNVEQRYCQTEREALSLVWACERFSPYLLGNQFDLITDHEPLKTIYGSRSKPCARIERWVLRLMPYDYRVVYWPGSKNIADPLSRLGADSCRSQALTEAAEAYVRFVALNSVPRAMTAREIERASWIDPELIAVRSCIKSGDFSKNSEIPASYRLISSELCTVGNLILRGSRIIIPSKLRQRVIGLAHEGHLGMVATKRNLRTKVWWPNLDKDVESHISSCHGCQLVSDLPQPEPIVSTPLPKGPWQDIAVDHFGPFNHTADYLLVVVDYYSRYFECRHVKSTSAAATIAELDEIFQTFGLPQTLKSDSGPAFISHEFRQFCENLGIKHSRGTPRWPQNNGLAA